MTCPVQVASPSFSSNTVQVPVQAVADSDKATGPVVNGVVVPNGVRSGPVRIHCCLYDHPRVNQTCKMDVQWSADEGSTWYRAHPDKLDAEIDGLYSSSDDRMSQVLPGETAFGSPAGLFYAGGIIRTFTWDAQNDDNFRAINNSVKQGGTQQARNFKISFRSPPQSPRGRSPTRDPDRASLRTRAASSSRRPSPTTTSRTGAP